MPARLRYFGAVCHSCPGFSAETWAELMDHPNPAVICGALDAVSPGTLVAGAGNHQRLTPIMVAGRSVAGRRGPGRLLPVLSASLSCLLLNLGNLGRPEAALQADDPGAGSSTRVPTPSTWRPATGSPTAVVTGPELDVARVGAGHSVGLSRRLTKTKIGTASIG